MFGHHPDTPPDNMLPRATPVVVDTPHHLIGTNPGRDLIRAAGW